MNFINFSNHPSAKWGKEQIDAALVYGTIVDYPFPAVAASISNSEIKDMAEKISAEIMNMEPAAVMCQGEFTLAYAVIRMLREKRITVVAACSERCVVEDSANVKTVVFQFEQFREYI